MIAVTKAALSVLTSLTSFLESVFSASQFAFTCSVLIPYLYTKKESMAMATIAYTGGDLSICSKVTYGLNFPFLRSVIVEVPSASVTFDAN